MVKYSSEVERTLGWTVKHLIYRDKSIVAWSETIRVNYEDCLQEMHTIALEELQRIATKCVAAGIKVKRKCDDTTEVVEVRDIEDFTSYELFCMLYKPVKTRFIRYLDKMHASINHKIRTHLHTQYARVDNETVQLDVDESLIEHINDDILQRVIDKSQQLQLQAVELLESLQGSLTAAQYDYLLKYVMLGKKPYDSSRMTRAIRNALKEYTTCEIATALSYKLHSMHI